MTFIVRRLRHYWWLSLSFFSKNFKPLITSFLVSFILIIFLVNSLPFINNLLFRKREKIGAVGSFKLANLPLEITQQLSNPLVSIDSRGEIVPVLANSWEVLDNHTRYRFHLKPNLTFNDGSEFSAHDIKVSFTGVKVSVTDKNTIEFILSQPLSVFPAYLSAPIVKNKIQGVAGAFHVQNYKLGKKGEVVLLNLYPNKKDLPYRIYRFYGSEEELITAYKKGEINLIRTPKKSIADLFDGWENTRVSHEVGYGQILTVFFNTESPLLQTREVRKALAMATPSFKELGVAANGPILPFSWAYKKDLKKYSLNLSQAKALLKKNVESTQSAQLNLDTFYDYINVAEEIKEMYEKIGLKTTLRVLSYMPSDFDILVTMWSPPSDPDQYYFWHSTQKAENLTHYKNVKVDKLLEDGRKVMTVSARKELYDEFQDIIIDEVPAHFVYHPYIYTIQRK